MRFSAAKTTPSVANTPIALPALEMASMAYSTWYNRPSGLNIVVRVSYLRGVEKDCGSRSRLDDDADDV